MSIRSEEDSSPFRGKLQSSSRRTPFFSEQKFGALQSIFKYIAVKFPIHCSGMENSLLCASLCHSMIERPLSKIYFTYHRRYTSSAIEDILRLPLKTIPPTGKSNTRNPYSQKSEARQYHPYACF